MRQVMNLHQSLDIYMRVNLRRVQSGMAEHLLQGKKKRAKKGVGQKKESFRGAKKGGQKKESFRIFLGQKKESFRIFLYTSDVFSQLSGLKTLHIASD